MVGKLQLPIIKTKTPHKKKKISNLISILVLFLRSRKETVSSIIKKDNYNISSNSVGHSSLK